MSDTMDGKGDRFVKKLIIQLAVISVFMLSFFSIPSFPRDTKTGDRTVSGKTGEYIERYFPGPELAPDTTAGGEPLYAYKMLERFYTRRNFLPAWSDDGGLSRNGGVLLESIEGIRDHGLASGQYHIESIHALRDYMREVEAKGNPPDAHALAEMDVLLTDAFLMLGCHFSAGCINPVTIETEWFARPDDLDVDLILEDALKAKRIKEALEDLLPPQPAYERLRKEMARYREIDMNGGWTSIKGSMILRKGDEHEQIINIKKRLLVSGDLQSGAPDWTRLFDAGLEEAVTGFQRRHGLQPDGIIGRRTIEAMNVSAGERVRQIEINLERMRWSSRRLGHRYIVVNIADFRLDVIEHGRTVMSMDVVVGKPYRYTPVMSETMTHIILNPSWNIPPRIAEEEVLPRIQEDPAYLLEQNITILSSWTDNAENIDPHTLNWSGMNADNFPYRFRQEPGPSNPLGTIKFMFPNRFNVYLHDTPARDLFSSNVRSFSHGCIRISRPLELAEYLLNGHSDWTREHILAGIRSGMEQKVDLPQPIHVHVLYLTAWVDEEGIMQFRRDIYGRDRRMYHALEAVPASSRE